MHRIRGVEGERDETATGRVSVKGGLVEGLDWNGGSIFFVGVLLCLFLRGRRGRSEGGEGDGGGRLEKVMVTCEQ